MWIIWQGNRNLAELIKQGNIELPGCFIYMGQGGGRWTLGKTSVNHFKIWIFTLSTYFTQQEFLLQIARDDISLFVDSAVEHDLIRVWKFETGTEWQIGWVSKALEF